MIVTCKTRKYCTFAETSTVACSTKVCIVCLFCFFAMANPANNTDTNTRCYPETLLLFTRWTMHLEKQPMLSLLRHWQQRHQCWKKRSRKRKKKCWNQWLWHKWHCPSPSELSKTVIRIFCDKTKCIILYFTLQAGGTLLCQGRDCVRCAPVINNHVTTFKEKTTWNNSQPPN